MNAKAVLRILKSAYSQWSEHRDRRMAAALAYYMVFALPSILIIATTLVSLLLGQAAQGQIQAELEQAVGPEAAAAITTAVTNTAARGPVGIAAGLIGFVILLWAASGVFIALREDLNRIWGVEPNRETGFVGQARKKLLQRALIFLLVIVIGLTAVLAILANWVVGVVLGLFSEFGFGPDFLGQVLYFLASVVVLALLFAFIYKALPQTTIAWRDVWIGAAVTAFLVVLSREVISLYISLSTLGSVYGVAGSIIVLLVYVYYVAQVLLFGAEFTHVYAMSHQSSSGQ